MKETQGPMRSAKKKINDRIIIQRPNPIYNGIINSSIPFLNDNLSNGRNLFFKFIITTTTKKNLMQIRKFDLKKNIN